MIGSHEECQEMRMKAGGMSLSWESQERPLTETGPELVSKQQEGGSRACVWWRARERGGHRKSAVPGLQGRHELDMLSEQKAGQQRDRRRPGGHRRVRILVDLAGVYRRVSL